MKIKIILFLSLLSNVVFTSDDGGGKELTPFEQGIFSQLSKAKHPKDSRLVQSLVGLKANPNLLLEGYFSDAAVAGDANHLKCLVTANADLSNKNIRVEGGLISLLTEEKGLDVVKVLLEGGYTNIDRISLLHQLAYFGRFDDFTKVINALPKEKRGGLLEKTDAYGNTVLGAALKMGSQGSGDWNKEQENTAVQGALKIVGFICETSESANISDFDGQAIVNKMLEAGMSSEKIIKFVTDNKLNIGDSLKPDARLEGISGISPMMQAVALERNEIIPFLMKQGVSVNRLVDNSGTTVLRQLICLGKVGVLQGIFNADSGLKLSAKDARSALESSAPGVWEVVLPRLSSGVFHQKFDMDERARGKTLAHIAIREKEYGKAALIFNEQDHVGLGTRDILGKTVLHYLLEDLQSGQEGASECIKGASECITCFLERLGTFGEDVRWNILNIESDGGITPVDLAICSKDYGLVGELLKLGVDVEILRSGRFLEELLLERGQLELVNQCIRQRSNFDRVDENGNTLLHFLVSNGGDSVCSLLVIALQKLAASEGGLNKACSINNAFNDGVQRINGYTPAGLAIIQNKPKMFKIFLDRLGLDVLKCQGPKSTPLLFFLAARAKDDKRWLKIFRDVISDPDVKIDVADRSGNTLNWDKNQIEAWREVRSRSIASTALVTAASVASKAADKLAGFTSYLVRSFDRSGDSGSDSDSDSDSEQSVERAQGVRAFKEYEKGFEKFNRLKKSFLESKAPPVPRRKTKKTKKKK